MGLITIFWNLKQKESGIQEALWIRNRSGFQFNDMTLSNLTLNNLSFLILSWTFMDLLNPVLRLYYLIFTQKALFLWDNTAKTFAYIDYINHTLHTTQMTKGIVERLSDL